MDYRLRRQPDGTVNAEPGDAVEVFDNDVKQWLDGFKFRSVEFEVDNGIVVVELYDSPYLSEYPLEHVRHARGGAGWHRLREARLRAVVEAMIADAKEDNAWDVWQPAEQALADLDNAEPEA